MQITNLLFNFIEIPKEKKILIGISIKNIYTFLSFILFSSILMSSNHL